MLLYILAIHLVYNAVAARSLLGRTAKNIICYFLSPPGGRLVLQQLTFTLRNIKQSKSFPAKVGEYPNKHLQYHFPYPKGGWVGNYELRGEHEFWEKRTVT